VTSRRSSGYVVRSARGITEYYTGPPLEIPARRSERRRDGPRRTSSRGLATRHAGRRLLPVIVIAGQALIANHVAALRHSGRRSWRTLSMTGIIGSRSMRRSRHRQRGRHRRRWGPTPEVRASPIRLGRSRNTTGGPKGYAIGSAALAALVSLATTPTVLRAGLRPTFDSRRLGDSGLLIGG